MRTFREYFEGPPVHSSDTDDTCKCGAHVSRMHTHYSGSREEADAWLECEEGHRQYDERIKLEAGER